MMQPSETISDKKVFAQIFKSFKMGNLNVDAVDNEVFNSEGYLIKPVYISWSGSLEEGREICKLFDLFGYIVDWDVDKARKISITGRYKKHK